MKQAIITTVFVFCLLAKSFCQPAGTIIAYAGKSIPKGWEICDGREVSKTDAKYAALYNAIKNTWGGNANPNFKLPDLRGQFLMGVSVTSEVSQSGGASHHNHGGATSDAFERPGTPTVSDGYRVDNDRRSPQATGLAHKHTIEAADNLPPYKKILYLIKL